MQFLKKYRLACLIIFFLIIIAGFSWFFNKFFPAQTGEWSEKDKNNFEESVIPNSGWLTSSAPQDSGKFDAFWISLDFPGKQNTCLNIYSKTKILNNSNWKIPITQAPRAYFYPVSGTLFDFFSEMSPAKAEENIRQGKPYYLGHLINNVSREGKNIFFLGENEKFLIPTKAIFSKHFPLNEIPVAKNDGSSLPYANVLINLPEGILLSDGKGVFIMSQGKLFLVRSPEVFESMGYKWEDIKQMDNYEKSFNSYLSGNLIDFDFAHPNGTILKKNTDYFLVWNEKLYQLTSEERQKYFPEQPVMEIAKKDLQADCLTHSESYVITCCVRKVDSRLNPPNYNPFLNTMMWNTNQVIKKGDTTKITWQSRIVINEENGFRRLNSLKNFILYGLGIVK